MYDDDKKKKDDSSFIHWDDKDKDKKIIDAALGMIEHELGEDS
jgi:hypothetical protein